MTTRFPSIKLTTLILLSTMAFGLSATGFAYADAVSLTAPQDGQYTFLMESDIPLPTGFQADIERSIFFDKPNGRILHAYAIGSLPGNEVSNFYKASLPSLGWTLRNNSPQAVQFERDGEVLTVMWSSMSAASEDSSISGQTQVFFSLKPVN